jgi:hypothetical protein
MGDGSLRFLERCLGEPMGRSEIYLSCRDSNDGRPELRP